MSDPRPLTFGQAREMNTKLRGRRAEAIREYEKVLKDAADKKQDYRRAMASAHVTAAAEGGTAEHKKDRAREHASEAEKATGYADAAVKVAKEKLDAIEADRAMLNAFIDWSKQLNRRGIE